MALMRVKDIRMLEHNLYDPNGLTNYFGSKSCDVENDTECGSTHFEENTESNTYQNESFEALRNDPYSPHGFCPEWIRNNYNLCKKCPDNVNGFKLSCTPGYEVCDVCLERDCIDDPKIPEQKRKGQFYEEEREREDSKIKRKNSKRKGKLCERCIGKDKKVYAKGLCHTCYGIFCKERKMKNILNVSDDKICKPCLELGERIPIHGLGLCYDCYQKRYSLLRRKTKFSEKWKRRGKNEGKFCERCEPDERRPVHALGLCHPCYRKERNVLKRKHRIRTEEIIDEQCPPKKD